MSAPSFKRRRLLQGAAALTGASSLGRLQDVFAQASAPAVVTPPSERPILTCGAMSGDVTGGTQSGNAIVWSRADRPARMIVDWSYDEAMKSAQRITGPAVME
ncbi:MAG: alkaline phosphatase, partial [Betaproteobacteria bacterium]|nr:alkaline phosphatase [Betaproteobacteria bacterium]